MTRRQFDEWVAKMVEKYKSEKFWSACETRTVKDVVICVDRNHKIGIAKCHPDDEFNPFIGTAIAYARMRGFEVPKVSVYKRLSEMKYGEKFRYISHCDTYMTKIFIAKVPNTSNKYVVSKKGYISAMEDCGQEYEMVE